MAASPGSQSGAPPRLFLVASRGYTATKWIARVLSEHPSVYCNHSAGTDVLDRDYTLGELEAVVEDKWFDRDQQPVAVFLRELIERGGATAYGNVHRYGWTTLKHNLETYPCDLTFAVGNMLRNPVPWVESGTAQMTRMSEGVHYVRWQLLDHFLEHRVLYRDLAREADLLAWENLAFVFMCWRLVEFADEVRDDGVRHFRMEDITTAPEAFAGFVEHLTGISVAHDKDYLQRCLGGGPIHRHRASAETDAETLWMGWQPWQRAVFSHWAGVGQVRNAFAEHGYVLPSFGG